MDKSSAQVPPDDFEGEVIDIEPRGGTNGRRARRWALVLVVVALLVAASRAGSVYLETLWFGSLGYASAYWTAFWYEWSTFAAFVVASDDGVGRAARRGRLRRAGVASDGQRHTQGGRGARHAPVRGGARRGLLRALDGARPTAHRPRPARLPRALRISFRRPPD